MLRTTIKKNLSRFLVALLSVALVFTMMPLNGMGVSYAEPEDSLSIQTPALVVTGTGVLGGSAYSASNVSKECSYSLDELKTVAGEYVYSSKKQKPPFTKSQHRVKGIELGALVSDLTTTDERVCIVATDGYTAAFQKGGTYRNEEDNVTGLGTYKNLNSIEPAPGFDQPRYWYEDFVESKATEVPAVIAWNYAEQTEDQGGVPESAGTEDKNLRLYVGQLGGGDYAGPEDMNGPLLNGGSKAAVNRVLVGDPIDEVMLTVDDQTYTRADLLLMPFASKEYDYENSSGAQHAAGKGVPMSVLLDGYADSALVSFTTVDDYPVNDDQPMTVGELVKGNYILAYEIDGKTVYDTAKNDSSLHGYFTLMGDGFKPAKMINGITVSKGEGPDFSTSEYKHITNGGLDQEGPYNIDAITGATLTIEGPGTETSVPLSVKDMESRNAGCFRDVYTDVRNGVKTERTYEGVDLYYLLHNMKSGDNGIKLTDEAKRVLIKNRNRKTIAELTLDDIQKMHDEGRPAIVAYGTAYADGTGARPFVFDGGTGENLDLGNNDGCLKFVYDRDKYGGNENYTKFGNMAYIYVEREKTPGFKHDKAPYNTAKNTQYVLTVTGDEIGREINYKVADLEKLVEYDADGEVVDNGYGWRSEYSLANSSYWYVNTYEGVTLWSLLRHSGVDAAKASDESTKVTFRSTDNYGGFDVFSLKQVADPDSFGFYEKNANDNNDGTYVGNENIRVDNDVTTGDKLSVGYPVLVSYGVNGYPYVINKDLKGYLSGLSNDGGPLRVISGKMNYSHANGSNQAKLLDKIIVGEDTYHYSTHAFQPADSKYKELKDQPLKVVIKNGTNKVTKTYTVEDLENLIYDGTLSAAQLREARVKDYYETGKKGKYQSDLYEGVNLKYFLKNVVELQGSQGTITFKAGKKKLSMSLSKALKMKNGYNAKTKLDTLFPVIAFAKNGYPMVKGTGSEGYLASDQLTAVSTASTEATSFKVKNSGGPLQVIFPRTSKKAKTIAGSLASVNTIVIDLKPDKYAHVRAPYNKLGKNELTVSGDGTRLLNEKTFTVNDLEGKQSLVYTKDFSIRNNKGKVQKIRYRGLSLYEFLKSTDVGLKTNADKVLVYTSANPTEPYVFGLSEIMKDTYYSAVTKKKDLPVLLAYGSSSVKIKNTKLGKPLVKTAKSKGYSKKYKNSGGPLKLVVGQTDKNDVNAPKVLNDVIKIVVTSSETVSWKHNSSELFMSYLDDTLEMKVVGNDGTERTDTLTVEELENMNELISQEKIYAVSENTWEGLNFWQLIQTQFADVPGIDDPITITVKAKDGYSADVVEKAGLDGLKNGIKDGENRVPVLLAYAVDGYPLAAGGKTTPIGVGYDSTVDNKGGPLRLMVHNAQGACIMEVISITVKTHDTVPSKMEASSIKTSSNAASSNAASVKQMSSAKVTKSEAPAFKTYEGTGAEGQLPMAGIRSTAMDKDGNLWVGTYGGGAAVQASGSEEFTIYNTKSEPALSTGFVSALCPDDQGGVWMTQNASYSDPSNNKGVVYMKDGDLTYYRAPNMVPNDYVQEIKIDASGNVWFGSFGGLTKYDPARGTWQTWDDRDGFPAMSVDNIEFDANGGIWCGFYPDSEASDGSMPFIGGFAYFKDGEIISYQYTSPPDSMTGFYRLGDVWIRDIAVDQNGGAWIIASGSYAGMDNVGGTVWYVASPRTQPIQTTGFDLLGKEYFDGASNSELRMVTIDPEGGLWFGTSADGVLYIKDPVIKDGKLKVTEQFDSTTGAWPETPSYNNVYSLDFYGKTLYSGTANGLAVCDFSGGFPEDNPLDGVVPSLTSAKAKKGKVVLKWKTVNEATGYEVYRAAKKAGKYKLVKTVNKAKTVQVSLSTKKLKKNKRYYYKIKAFKKTGETTVTSSFSNIKSAKVKK
ncbi:MAG: hypothetical protein IJI74_04090 [Firmicutes bacterium]|nr:hypothetical protein [Bacillota bacterium]